jgi:hypothetical protein
LRNDFELKKQKISRKGAKAQRVEPQRIQRRFAPWRLGVSLWNKRLDHDKVELQFAQGGDIYP